MDTDLFEGNTIKSLVLDSLSKEPKKSADLVEEIKDIRKGTTKQGVYKALRALIGTRVIVKYRKNLMLNQIWLNKMGEFLKQADENYLSGQQGRVEDTFDWMTEGSKMSYTFSNYDALDRFHSHLFSLIIKKTDSLSPVYVYNPHEWFVLKTNLKENENYLIDWLRERNRQLYFTIGHETVLDKKFRDAYTSDEFQIALDEGLRYPENYYLNVIGNYVIETTNEKTLAEKIHAVYASSENEDEASEKIKTLLGTKQKIKMVLSFDSQRAQKLRMKLGKNFYIPKELRDR